MRNKLILAALTSLFATPILALDCESGMRPFTHSAGELCVPERPMRIVTMNDQILTLPLYELGAPLVGSLGRVADDGTPFMRGGMDTLGIDYSNTNITFVGVGDEVDLEAIAALEPDLIVGITYTDPDTIEKLNLIAPTPVLDEVALGFEGTLRALADLAGRTEQFETRFALYQANIERTRSYIGNPDEISIATTFVFTSGAKLSAYRDGLGAYTRVINDIGFTQIDLVADIEGDRISLSPEMIEGLDADFIVGFYRSRATSTPEAIFAAYEIFVPGFCEALNACRNNQLILLPSITYGGTMKSLELAHELIESHIAARGFTPLAAN